MGTFNGAAVCGQTRRHFRQVAMMKVAAWLRALVEAHRSARAEARAARPAAFGVTGAIASVRRKERPMTVQHRWPRSRWAPTDGHTQTSGLADELVRAQPDPVFLTVQEVAELLRVSPATVRAWIARGDGPPAMRFGKQIRYRPESVMEWIEQQEEEYP